MSKATYKLSTLAQEHLLKISAYTKENFGNLQWEKYKKQLLSGFQMLADNPKIGKSCDDLYPNGLYFPIEQHTAYYTIEKDFILIAAVLGQVY